MPITMDPVRSARSPVLFGRERELAAIRRGLDDACRGRGGALFVAGEAGSGKSALLAETRAMAQAAGMVHLGAKPPRAVRSPAFGVLAAVLRSWTRSHHLPVEGLAPFAWGLCRVLPEWPAPSRPLELSTDQLHLLTLEGAFRLLLHAAGRPGSGPEHRSGAAVLLDDLQDADLETLEFVHHAAASCAGEPLFLLGAIRTPEGRAAEVEARGLESVGLATVVDLRPLAQGDVAGVIEAILGVPPPPGLAAHVAARSDGIPLLIEELVEAHLSAGTLRVQWGGAHWSGDEFRVTPATLAGVVTDKLSRVSSTSRLILLVSGLLDGFDPDLVAASAGVDPACIPAALREGVEVGLLESVGQELVFRHGLIRDTLVDSVVPPERVVFHARAAAAMERLHGDDPSWLEERARHLEAAGEHQAAAALLVDAGARHLDTPASAEAILQRALRLASDPSTRADALDHLAIALGALGRWDDALCIDKELLDLGGEDPDRLTRMARHAVQAGRPEEAEDLIQRARWAGADEWPLVSLTALALLWRGRLHESIDAANEALAAAESAGDQRRMCEALDVLGRATDALGHRSEAQAYFVRWVELAKAEGLVDQHLRGLLELGVQEFLAGGDAAQLFRARDLAEHHHAYAPLVLADLCLVWWLGRRGRVGEAAAAGETAVDVCRRFSLHLLPHALMDLGWVRNLARCGSGESLVADALSLAPDDEDLQILGGWIRGEAALREGRALDAVGHLEDATRRMAAAPAAVPPPAPFLLVPALLLAGRIADAVRALDDARRSPALPRQFVNRFWLAVGEALVSGDRGRFERSAAAYRGSATFDVAVAQVIAAIVLGGSETVSWLRQALAAFEAGGLETDAARARQLLRSHGGPVPRRRRQAVGHPLLADHGVTRREAEVLALVGRGRTNGQIAERLFLSPRTVQTHVGSLLRKLEAPNRGTLIALALQLERGESGAPGSRPVAGP